jgi:hypothetical protein
MPLKSGKPPQSFNVSYRYDGAPTGARFSVFGSQDDLVNALKVVFGEHSDVYEMTIRRAGAAANAD